MGKISETVEIAEIVEISEEVEKSAKLRWTYVIKQNIPSVLYGLVPQIPAWP